MPGKQTGPKTARTRGGMTPEETRYHERLLREERRRAFEEGLELAIAMSADPNDLVEGARALAKADAAVIMSGRRRGYVMRRGYLWGERKTIDDRTEDLFDATFPLLRNLANLKATVRPHFHGDIWAFVDHMHVYKNKAPRGRSLRHMKVPTLDREYNKQLEASLKGLPAPAAPDRTLIDGPAAAAAEPKPKSKPAAKSKPKSKSKSKSKPKRTEK